MCLTQKDVKYLKSIIDCRGGQINLFISSKKCVEALEADNESVVIHSKYPGENNKYIVEGVKKGNKYVFMECCMQ